MGELAKLTDIRIRNAKPQDKPVKLADGGGLSLLIKPDGGRYWRYNYRFHGKQRTMALGVYPVVSAKEARERHQAARTQLAQGADPMAERKVAKLTAANDMAEDFEAVARALWASKLRAGRSAGYVESIIEKLEKDVFPWIGTRPVSQIRSLKFSPS